MTARSGTVDVVGDDFELRRQDHSEQAVAADDMAEELSVLAGARAVTTLPSASITRSDRIDVRAGPRRDDPCRGR